VYRTTENGQPIDDSGDLEVGSDVDGKFEGAAQLAQKLVGSKQLVTCFMKQAYRYAMGQVEETTTAPTLAAMETGFSVDSHITDALVSLVGQPAFVLRTTTQPGL